jgi:hypothetical protein
LWRAGEYNHPDARPLEYIDTFDVSEKLGVKVKELQFEPLYRIEQARVAVLFDREDQRELREILRVGLNVKMR